MNIKTKILLILSILFINIGIGSSQKSEMNHVVINRTEYGFLDTIVKIGLNKMDIERTRVFIDYMDMDFVSRTEMRTHRRLKAYIIKRGGNYTIYVGKYSKRNSIVYISHELVHLKQYHDGKLKISENDVVYDGRVYRYPIYLPYEDRPWETEAFRKSRNYKKIIKKELDNLLN